MTFKYVMIANDLEKAKVYSIFHCKSLYAGNTWNAKNAFIIHTQYEFKQLLELK